MTSEALIEGIRESGHRSVTYVEDETAIRSFLEAEVRQGDLIACFGAGTIDGMARRLGGTEES